MTSASIYPLMDRRLSEHQSSHETWDMRHEMRVRGRDERWEKRLEMTSASMYEIGYDVNINGIDWRWRQYQDQCNRLEMTSAWIYQSIIRRWCSDPSICWSHDRREREEMAWASIDPKDGDDVSIDLRDERWRQDQCKKWEMTSASIYPSIHPSIDRPLHEIGDWSWVMKDALNIHQHQSKRCEMTSASI